MADVTQIRLRPDDGCAKNARRFVNEQLIGVLEDRRENVLLVTSELVTNAYRHGSGMIEVRLEPTRTQVLIEVIDQGVSDGVAIRKGSGETGGWGLRIVDQLADEWGVRSGTTQVWAKLPLS